MRATDRIAVSHDGNNWDMDDTYAYAMDYAVIWAHGMQNQFVHAQINNLLKAHNNPEYMAQMLESGKGRTLFPGFDPSIQFDCVLDDGKAAIAHFASVANQSSDQSLLFFAVGGPMEIPWQSINAVAVDKRKYIRVLSHSKWNEDHTTPILTHTFNNMMSSFSKDGVIFYGGSQNNYTAPNIVLNQNSNLGGGAGAGQWDFLNAMAGSSIPQSTWTWLKNRNFKGNGDCSDNGLVWTALTGNQNIKAADAKIRFLAPLASVPKFPGSTEIMHSSKDINTLNGNFKIQVQKNGNTLNISLPNQKGKADVMVYDLLSRVVTEGSMQNGIANLPVNSTKSGRYLVKISADGIVNSQVVRLKK